MMSIMPRAEGRRGSIASADNDFGRGLLVVDDVIGRLGGHENADTAARGSEVICSGAPHKMAIGLNTEDIEAGNHG